MRLSIDPKIFKVELKINLTPFPTNFNDILAENIAMRSV
jgi:hypothetical protein